MDAIQDGRDIDRSEAQRCQAELEDNTATMAEAERSAGIGAGMHGTCQTSAGPASLPASLLIASSPPSLPAFPSASLPTNRAIFIWMGTNGEN